MINKPVKIRIRLLAGTAVVAAVSVGALLVISGATLPATGSTVNPSLSLEYRGEPKERVDIGPIASAQVPLRCTSMGRSPPICSRRATRWP